MWCVVVCEWCSQCMAWWYGEVMWWCWMVWLFGMSGGLVLVWYDGGGMLWYDMVAVWHGMEV